MDESGSAWILGKVSIFVWEAFAVAGVPQKSLSDITRDCRGRCVGVHVCRETYFDFFVDESNMVTLKFSKGI